MRDPRFIAMHSGGKLDKQDHKKLMLFSISCAYHLFETLNIELNITLKNALDVAQKWIEGQVRTKDAMRASVRSHAYAREQSDPICIAAARAVGQAVATAHMADHSIGVVIYSLIAIKHSGKDLEKERKWQLNEINKLPDDLKEAILKEMKIKEKGFKILR